ncbi:MAG TPA: response regulator [Chloroflexia bacterium]|nr:response regulator [Chloroflexia bacterium]
MATILVVDDEPSLLSILEAILQEQGHAVFTAGNGQEALDLLQATTPDLILSDVMMPVMDGYQLVQQIRSRPAWQHIKIVLISAAPIRRTPPLPIDETIAKPYDLDTVETLIDRLLGPS